MEEWSQPKSLKSNKLSKKNNKTILLFGPTTSGKSKLALDIAKKYKGEIINADSMQVYREIRILSARPNNKNIKHHFYGFISVKRNFSVGSWYKLAAKKIQEIKKRGKTPIIVGGTGLYFKTLTDGLSEIPTVPKINANIKIEKNYILKNQIIFRGIPINDKQRLQRALSVYKHTGKPIWFWQKKK